MKHDSAHIFKNTAPKKYPRTFDNFPSRQYSRGKHKSTRNIFRTFSNLPRRFLTHTAFVCETHFADPKEFHFERISGPS